MTEVVWPSAHGETRFAFGAVSATGPVRVHNEDSLLAQPPVFLVADGMGGHERGDVASASAIAEFRARAIAPQPWTTEAVLDAVRTAHAAIAALAPADAIAGTTLTGVVLVAVGGDAVASADEQTGRPAPGPEEFYRWMVLNVGDSRVYRLEGNTLHQVTTDHSIVQELIERGALTPEDARHHPERNVITRALGVAAEAVPDVLLLPAMGEQVFLVCSDGVSAAAATDELAEIILSLPPDRAAGEIVATALANGSRDNATAIVLRAGVQIAGRDGRDDDSTEETQPTVGAA